MNSLLDQTGKGWAMRTCAKNAPVGRCPSSGAALPPFGLSRYASQSKTAAAIARGHRTYLDPNPKLIHARTRASRTQAPKGHRQFIGGGRR